MTPEQFAEQAPIHPDSLQDYRLWHQRLCKWNARINLVAPNSLESFWNRHALDSAQIVPHIPDLAEKIVDFGSGAGFPGLSVAIDAKHNGRDQHVWLIESAGKKASFLKSVSRETHLPVTVCSDRIEALDPLDADVITARAFAPLHRMLPMAKRHMAGNGRLVLLKGAHFANEVKQAQRDWAFNMRSVQSLTDPTASLLIIENLERHECFT
ncbi:16S rRNA (guanine(527)-N(7))-methyltransferase RsmG [uncultured Algimonas sp.]|uniref:16S rRNA (guanine(527)-N(7))-methyltransferase RsmG n=1 Tax=uncultured Algimonas sp. TaxID=1547920 RepID=UPI0026159514|nr:16S rRNA (guanine(527)-N(7))-methyltransferase RsmG [uncultured Algimonas sp.]